MDLENRRCVPCEGGIPALAAPEEDERLLHVPGWVLVREGIHRIEREYRFNNFSEGMDFANRVAEIAESEGHHPDLAISYGRVEVSIHTHAVKGLTDNDFILAAKIGRIA